jgi:hypothetical protein
LLGAQASSPADCELNNSMMQRKHLNSKSAIGNSKIHILVS